MDGLPDQIMRCLLNDEDKSEAFLLDRVVATFGADQGSAEVIDSLFGTFSILLSEQSA